LYYVADREGKYVGHWWNYTDMEKTCVWKNSSSTANLSVTDTKRAEMESTPAIYNYSLESGRLDVETGRELG